MTRSRSFDDSGYPAAVSRGLISNTVWDSGVIGYHLEYSDWDENGRNDWLEDGAAEAMASAFAVWANVANFTFTATTRANANLIERITDAGSNEDPDSDSVTLAFHYLPGGNSGDGLQGGRQSDGEYNHDVSGWSAAGLTQGGSGFGTIVHEIGHALGLEHPFDDDLFAGSSGESFGDYGAFGLNQQIYSVMSYNRGWIGNGGSSPSVGYGRAGTPLALDIAAIQDIYGANMNFATGNDTYTLQDTNGSGTYYSSIWDAGGTDTIAYDGPRDANIFLDQATIDDTPTGGGLLSYIDGIYGGFTVARGAVIENARTGSGDDVIGGSDGDNRIDAGAGNDIIMGLGGDDVILGGAGDDIIMGDYRSVAEFGVALTAAPPQFEGPSLPDGLSLGTGSRTVSSSATNQSRSTAIDLSDDFRLQSRADVQDGDSFHTVSTFVTTGSSGYSYFSFTLHETATVVMDIDNGFNPSGAAGSFDPYLILEDGAGNTVDFNDDLVSDDQGSTPSSSGRNLDSFLSLILDPDTYYIKVGQYDSGDSGFADLDPGFTFRLNLTADGYAFTDELPMLTSEAGFAQFGYYYETPDFSDIIGGYNAEASGGGAAQSESGGPIRVTSTFGEGHHEGDGHDHSQDYGCGCDACCGAQKPEDADSGILVPTDDAMADAVFVPELPAIPGDFMA